MWCSCLDIGKLGPGAYILSIIFNTKKIHIYISSFLQFLIVNWIWSYTRWGSWYHFYLFLILFHSEYPIYFLCGFTKQSICSWPSVKFQNLLWPITQSLTEPVLDCTDSQWAKRYRSVITLFQCLTVRARPAFSLQLDHTCRATLLSMVPTWLCCFYCCILRYSFHPITFRMACCQVRWNLSSEPTLQAPPQL